MCLCLCERASKLPPLKVLLLSRLLLINLLQNSSGWNTSFKSSHLHRDQPSSLVLILIFSSFSLFLLFPLSLYSTRSKRKQELLDRLIIHRDKQTRKEKKKRAKDQKRQLFVVNHLPEHTLKGKKKAFENNFH